VANTFGLDMASETDDIHLQKILSAILLSLATILIYAASRIHLGRLASLTLAAIFGFCTTLTSTMGSALWSHDAAIVFILIGVYALNRIYSMSGNGRHGALAGLMGFVVVMAWLCRPTAAVFGLTIGAYLALTRPRLLLPFVSTIVVVGVAFVAWSWRELHQILPDYYLPSRLGGSVRFGEALVGHLFSPSRGLFVFSPVLVLTVVGIFRHRRSIMREPLARIVLIWLTIFWLAISRFPHWWGGYCFGSRLLADTMPAWAILTIMVWREDGRCRHSRVKPLVVGLWVVTAAWGFYVNSVKGLHEDATVRWNERPDIDTHPELLFDWRFPQFLASNSSLDKRELRMRLTGSVPYQIGTVIDPEGVNAVLSGFNAVERDGETAYRWTEGNSARVFFRTAADGSFGEQLEMNLRCAFFGSQHVTVMLNGTSIGELDGRDFPPVDHVLLVPNAAWSRGQARRYQEIELRMPGAQRAGDIDRRVLAVALYSLRFSVAPRHP
jgi:hypothetical protein